MSKDYKPFDPVSAKKIFLPKQYFQHQSDQPGTVNTSQMENDFALVVLNDNIGNNLGWLGVKYDEAVDDIKVSVVSYPGDKKDYLVYDKCKAKEPGYSKKVFDLNCDIMKGSSGASLIDKDNLVWGVVSAESKKINKAFRFNKETFGILLDWMNDKSYAEDTLAYNFSQDDNFTLKIKNKCDEKIIVAYRVKKKDGFKTDGLYIVKPGKSMTVYGVTDRDYYYYAKSASGGRWGGNYDFYLEDYDKTFSFAKSTIKINSMNGTQNQSLTCN